MLITAKKLRQIVRAFKKNPNEDPKILQDRIKRITDTVDSSQFTALSFDQKLEHCQVLFELLDVHSRLPKTLQKNLWKLYMVYQGYKALKGKEEKSWS